MALGTPTNGKTGSGTGGTAASSSMNSSAGSGFHLAINWDRASTITSIGDNNGHVIGDLTLIDVEQDDASAGMKHRAYILPNGGAAKTGLIFTVVTSGGSVVIAVQELPTGNGNGVLYDTGDSANDSASPFANDTFNSTHAVALAVSSIGGNSGSNPATHDASANGYTITSGADFNDGVSNWTVALATKALVATGAQICSWTETGGSRANVATGVVYEAAATSSLEQEGYRWRNDDGNETTATWISAQDVDINLAANVNRRLRMLVNATGDPATIQYLLEYKLSSDSAYKTVEVAGGGSVAFGTAGAATTTGTTAPTVAYPASIVKGDLLILAVTNRPNASTPTTPSGWTAASNYTATGGAGSEAAGTGTVRISVFTKEADGTETGSLTLAITSGASCGALMWRVTKTTGKNWSVVLANGSDNSAGTGYSATMGSDPGVTSGDLVFVASGTSEDTATFASEALTQTGVTYAAITERTDTAITTGNDLHLVVTEHPITSGTSSAAATYAMTASGTNAANTAGASVMIRVRQVDQPFQMSLSANITASGDNTTAQLTAPSGKTTGNFTTGRMQDDENPADTVDIASGNYTELEWCIKAITAQVSDGQIYQFRVTSNGTAFGTYTLTPQYTIGGVFTLVVADATHAHSTDGIVLVPDGATNLVVADATHAHSTDAIALTQQNTLVVAEALHAHTTDAIALTQANTLAVQEALHAHSTDGIALTQANTLVVSEALHAHTTDAISLTQANTLAVAEATHAHSTDAINLTQQNTLAVQEATHAHSADSVSLTQANTLAVQEALHDHTADNLTLTQANTLVVSETLHAHTTDSISLTQQNTLAVQEALHAHTADNVSLTQDNTLAVQETLHAHSADNVALTQANTLVVSDALHAHSVDSVSLTQANALAIQDSTHANLADNIVLTLGLAVNANEATHGHTADNVVLTQANTLVVSEALHAHTTDAITLAIGFLLAVADSLHAHSSDAIVLSTNNLLAVQEALHSHFADVVTLTQQNTLVVQDTVHGHHVDLVALFLLGVTLPPIERRIYFEAIVRELLYPSAVRTLDFETVPRVLTFEDIPRVEDFP